MATVVMRPHYEQAIERMAMPLVHRTTAELARSVKRRIKRRTGALRGSVHVRKNLRDGEVVIGTDHWRYYEYGTKPHVIRGVTKKVLSDGTNIFGPEVMHPGTRAYAPMRKALEFKAAGSYGFRALTDL